MLLHMLIVGLVLAWTLILALCWLGWQLLRQNGRMLLRLDELENRLNGIEFGQDEQPTSLPVGSEAPDFDLPDLAGENISLAKYRGRPVLLIFFNPACGFCRELLPKLQEKSEKSEPDWPGNQQAEIAAENVCSVPERPSVLIVSTGDAEANRTLFEEEHRVRFPVLLQEGAEVAGAYRANGTPSGYLIDAAGKIASPIAMGGEALMQLLSTWSSRGNEALAEHSVSPNPGSQMDRSLVTSAATGNGEDRGARFNNRSLAQSKIKRDGLKAGTVAPEFSLPRLDGRGDLSLSGLRGRQVLLVFSSPGCGPCNTLAPHLERFHRDHPELEVLMISKDEPKENRAKVKEYGLTFPVVLQQQWEISRRYAMFATPIAYLIDEFSIIAHDVAIGVEPILKLTEHAAQKKTVTGVESVGGAGTNHLNPSHALRRHSDWIEPTSHLRPDLLL
jgi:peroxiredoxin